MSGLARKVGQRKPEDICLKDMCFRAVRKHYDRLGRAAVLDLPTPLLKDLLPLLTVCQLDELQPSLNQRGISTYSSWVSLLQDMCGTKHIINLHTEEEVKHKVMRTLFTVVLYGLSNSFVSRHITHRNASSFLSTAAKCIRHFSLMSLYKPLQCLIVDRQPVLELLEKRIRTVSIKHCMDLSKRETQAAFYVLHRLFDHGVANELVIHSQSPLVLAWLLHGRGSQYRNPELENIMHNKRESCFSQAAAAGNDDEDQVTPRKRAREDSVSVKKEKHESRKPNFIMDPHDLCWMFAPRDGPSVRVCPRGQIVSLEIKQRRPESLRVLTSALPTFFCLRSLAIHSFSILRDPDVMGLVGALRQLSESSRSSLTDLAISLLPKSELLEVLLDACPGLTSMHVELQTLTWGTSLLPPHHASTPESDMPGELPLKKLTVKEVAMHPTDVYFLTSVLRRCPHLTSLHVSGMRLPTGSSYSRLLDTLSESNILLKTLCLEDMKLSDCLPEILNLLRVCKLEELRLNDCRLLEKLSNKEESLQQLVAAVKTMSSLHTLGLAQNRLAKNVCVLAELFSGCSPSSVKRLDISSNFIQAAELLEFTQRLRTHHPPHQMTLDLRENPGDRDPDTWNAALKGLRPFCVTLIEGWTSTNTMADHISNM